MFKASKFEYKFRFVLHLVIFALGFFAPWDRALHLDPGGANAHVWGVGAVWLSRWMNTMAAFEVLLIVGIIFAIVSALLRVSGAAYLGYGVVQSLGMHGEAVVADGPYRHVRNPLYLGTWIHSLALALLMPPSGAVFTVVMIGLLQLRLMLAEESFLAAKLGQPYAEYCARVPRWFPSIVPRVAGSGAQPRWAQAVLGEMYMVLVALAFATLGWRYNEFLLTQCVLVALGVSLVVRSVLPRR